MTVDSTLLGCGVRPRSRAGRRKRRTLSPVVGVALCALAAACNRSQPDSIDASAGPSEAGADLGGARDGLDGSIQGDATEKPTPRRFVDTASAAKCTLSYYCGLSHPGLGSTSDLIAADLAQCTKTVSHSSRPYEEAPRPASPPPPPPKKKLAAATCRDLAKMLSEITDRDVREAREAARRDTRACKLHAACPEELFSVQRQTLTGQSPVVKLILALHSAR